MIIRYLTGGDVVQHDKISSQAFVYACDVHDPASALPCEKVLGAFDDDNETLFADFEIHEKKCVYDGGLLTCAAVGGVAAKPEHRGKGAVKALFRYLSEETGYDISVLYPFAEAYYRQFGYERVGCSLRAAVPFAELAGIGRNTDAALYEGNGAERLLEIYNRCAGNYNLCFVREDTEMFSAQPYLSQRYTYLWKDRSFATFSIDRGKSTVFVHEMYADSCESLLGIVGFLRNFEANQKTVCFENLPGDSPLLPYIRDLKPCEITLHSTGAARILNAEKVLRAHRYPAGSGAFTLRIGGEAYHVAYSDGGVAVDKGGRHAPDAAMGIHTASRLLLCGFTRPEDIPGLEIYNPASDLFRAFPPKTTFFTDHL